MLEMCFKYVWVVSNSESLEKFGRKVMIMLESKITFKWKLLQISYIFLFSTVLVDNGKPASGF